MGRQFGLLGEEGRREEGQEEKAGGTARTTCSGAEDCRQPRLLIIAPDTAHNSISKQITRTAV